MNSKDRQSRWQFSIRPRILMAAAMVCALLGLVVISSTPVQPSYVLSTASPSELETSAQPSILTVYVSGEVNEPGVLELPEGSRIAQALDQAGGPNPHAQLAGINLAEKLSDGQHIEIPAEGAEPAPDNTAGQPLSSTADSSLVNINQADAASLEALPRIGPAISARIVEYRNNNGNFQSIDELQNVPGIGPAMMKALRDKVTV